MASLLERMSLPQGAAPAVGGYQSPDPYYSGGGAPSTPGVGGITAGMAGMQMGGPGQPMRSHACTTGNLQTHQLLTSPARPVSPLRQCDR